MPPEPSLVALKEVYWGVGSLIAVILFLAAANKLRSWGQAEIRATVGPDIKNLVMEAVKAAFDDHRKEEKAWRDEERKEWREAIDGLRKEFRELERDLRQQLRQLERDVQGMNRPQLRKDDIEKLDHARNLSERLQALELLLANVRTVGDGG